MNGHKCDIDKLKTDAVFIIGWLWHGKRGDVTVRLKEGKGKKQARAIIKGLMCTKSFTGKR